MTDDAVMAADTVESSLPVDGAPAPLLVMLPAMPQAARELLDSNLHAAADGVRLQMRTPDPITAEELARGELQTYQPTAATGAGWLLTAQDYAEAAGCLRDSGASSVVLLGPDAASLSVASLRSLLAAARECDADVLVPKYSLGAHAGLVNGAILYPLSAALYGSSTRFPLPIDVVLSARAAERFGASSRRGVAAPGFTDLLLWPVAEATAERLKVGQFPMGERSFPPPPSADLQTALTEVVGSLFADAERKAAVWQRIRGEARPAAPPPPVAHEAQLDDVVELIANFRNAFANLQELWSLVLPPQSILQLKRLAASAPETFTLPDALWVRVVYDFLLAYRLRVLNTGHLLGAMTSLYLAWVASHLRQAAGDADAAERHIAALAHAFVVDKPYLVARWRWPDRFNP